jgi:hypothetical protein
MTINNFLEGVQLLRPFYDDPDGYILGAEHDIIYVYATDKKVSSTDTLARLFELGFFQPEVSIEDDPTVADYDPAEGWAAFV